MKNIILILLFTLTTPAAHAYDATYNFDAIFPEESAEAKKLQVEHWQKIRAERNFTDKQIADAKRLIDNTKKFHRLTELKPIIKACTADVLQLCGITDSENWSPCLQKSKKQLSSPCDVALKHEVGEVLTKESVIDGITLPERTKIFHGYNNEYKQKSIITHVLPPKPITHDNITYQAGKTYIREGIIISAMLAKDTQIGNIVFKGTRMPFKRHSNGVVAEGILAKDSIYQGVTFRAESYLKFYSNRFVEKGELKGKATIQGLVLHNPPRTSTYFHDNGKIERSTLAKNINFQNLPLLKNTEVGLHPNGYLKYAKLAQNTHYRGVLLKANHFISTHSNGYIKKGTLAEDITLNNKTYKAGSIIVIKRNGKVDEHGIASSEASNRIIQQLKQERKSRQ